MFLLSLLSYASSLAWCFFFFNACTHLHPHTRKTSHPSKYILAPVFNLFVCDGVSERLVLQYSLFITV